VASKNVIGSVPADSGITISDAHHGNDQDHQQRKDECRLALQDAGLPKQSAISSPP